MRAILGIDFGCRHCRTAVWEGSGARLVPNRYSDRPLPTLVSTAGERPSWARGPAMFTSLKQHAGTIDLTTVHGGAHAIRDGLADAFQHLHHDVRDAGLERLDGAVVAVPSGFPERARKALLEAAQTGLGMPVRFLDESLTVFFARGGRGRQQAEAPDRPALVFALGAGVFSVSVVSASPDQVIVRASAGHRALGGAAIDAAIVSFLLEQLLADSPQVESLSDLVIRLRPIAEALKHGLSRREEESFDLQGAELATSAGLGVELTLTRSALEDMMMPVVDETMRLTQGTLEEAGVTAQEIGRVILIGGSTRAPLVERRLHELCGAPIERAADGDVAIGAASYGATLDPTVWASEGTSANQTPSSSRTPVAIPQFAVAPPAAQVRTWFRAFAPAFDEAESRWNGGDQGAAIQVFADLADDVRKFLGNLHYQRGDALFRSEQYEEAIREQRAALECNPVDSLARGAYHRTLNRQSQRLLRAGRLADARETIREGLRIDPSCAECRTVAARIDEAMRLRSHGVRRGRRR